MNYYIALLRGINAGVVVKMAVLKEIFEGLGFQNAQTVLATGNVLFETKSSDIKHIEEAIETSVKKKLGYHTAAIVRPAVDVYHLVESQPFKHVTVTPRTVPQVTFVKNTGTKHPNFPLEGKGCKVLGIEDGVVFSVVDLSGGTTPDLMSMLQKIYGKDITTRNWKTIEKIILALDKT